MKCFLCFEEMELDYGYKDVDPMTQIIFQRKEFRCNPCSNLITKQSRIIISEHTNCSKIHQYDFLSQEDNFSIVGCNRMRKTEISFSTIDRPGIMNNYAYVNTFFPLHFGFTKNDIKKIFKKVQMLGTFK